MCEYTEKLQDFLHLCHILQHGCEIYINEADKTNALPPFSYFFISWFPVPCNRLLGAFT
jgi:hypothetical protein